MVRTSLAFLLLVIVQSACHRPLSPSEPTQRLLQASSDVEFRALWESCLDVLRRHRFEIDREDLRAGVISTYPVTSQHFLEFWRHDVDTAYDLAEATLHTMRRSIVIQISKPQGQADFTVDVAVEKERYHATERQINNAAAALRVFSADLPTVAGRTFSEETDVYWSQEGRDAAMEERLLSKILTRWQRRSTQ